MHKQFSGRVDATAFELDAAASSSCHGPRLKLKTRAALRPRDVLFGRQRSALTLTQAVLELSAPAS